MRRLPKRTIWIELDRGRYAFIKIDVNDTQMWIPREIVVRKGKNVRARIFDAEETKVYEDELNLYACSENGCKARLSKVFLNKKLIVGVI